MIPHWRHILVTYRVKFKRTDGSTLNESLATLCEISLRHLSWCQTLVVEFKFSAGQLKRLVPAYEISMTRAVLHFLLCSRRQSIKPTEAIVLLLQGTVQLACLDLLRATNAADAAPTWQFLKRLSLDRM